LRLRWQTTVLDDHAGKRKVEKEGSERMRARRERHSVGGRTEEQLKVVEVLRLRWQTTVQDDDDAGK